LDDLLRRRAREAHARIRTGELRGEALRALLLDVPRLERDAFADVVLGLDGAPADDVALPRGAVPYLPCSVDAISTFVRDVPLRADTTLVDLGSGLGRVVLLAHLLTGSSAHGIEIQPHLVAAARAAASALGLRAVTFVHANAAEVDLDGDVFFLYAPFNGAMLADVLRRIEAASKRRAIVVVTVDLVLDVPWLTRRPSSDVSLSIHDPCGPRSA
jgi:SAM-dependent methyltransferase